MKPQHSALTIFNNALDFPDPATRALYLNEACGTDAALRGRVENLLQAHIEAGGFFSQPLRSRTLALGASSMVEPGLEKAGDIIGRYKLLEQIGEGGCGVVYMAEQQEPVRRRVALKVIKVGMDTRLVEAEAIWREEIALERKLVGDEHPFVANSLLELTGLLLRAQRPDQAEATAREALAIRRKRLGDDHENTLNALATLGSVLNELQRHAEAVELLREDLAIRQKRYGEESIQTLEGLKNLAATEQRAKDWIGAERTYQ